MDEHPLVSTPVGRARLDWYRAAGSQRAVVVLGHGTAAGVEAEDLQALARALPPLDITVVLATQPYRLENNWRVANEQSLDRAWEALWPSVSAGDVPVVAGGRSAGSQVACRTARRVGAYAVLALAYPLLGPGSAAELLSTGKPTTRSVSLISSPRCRRTSNWWRFQEQTTCSPPNRQASGRIPWRRSPTRSRCGWSSVYASRSETRNQPGMSRFSHLQRPDDDLELAPIGD